MSAAPKIIDPGRWRHVAILRAAPDRVMTSRGTQPANPATGAVKARLRGELRTLQGKELEAAQQRWALASSVFDCFFVSPTLATDRMEVGGRIWQVLSAEDPDGLRMLTRFYLQEVK